jgi:hypothetical protein
MPRFTSQPAPAAVRPGDSQVLPCDINPDLAPFTRWEKDRQSLELGSRLVQLPSGALLISNASESDAGQYRCLVENVGQTKASEEAQLQLTPGKHSVRGGLGKLPLGHLLNNQCVMEAIRGDTLVAGILS